MAVIAHHDFLNTIDHPPLVPVRRAQEHLQRTGNNTGAKGDRLSTLALQVRVLPLHVNLQIRLGIAPSKAIRELRQKGLKATSNSLNLCDIHTSLLLKNVNRFHSRSYRIQSDRILSLLCAVVLSMGDFFWR